MKKTVLSFTLLLLFAISATAQISAEENTKAQAYIEQAKSYAQEQEYAQAAQSLQMAYDINPALLDCSSFQLLGLSYYMMEDATHAVKFLELSTKCEQDKETLAKIHTYLGYSHDELGNYKQAVENCQKAVLYSTNNVENSYIYEDVAEMHFDNDEFVKAVTAQKQSVRQYLKHLSITESDVMMGTIKDDALADKYLKIAWYADYANMKEQRIDYTIKAALCGSQKAIDFCRENNIAYQDAIEVPQTSTKEDQAAQALIDEATIHLSEGDNTTAVSNLEKAYTISPALFDGKTFMLWGLGSCMIEEYAAGIQYFNRALNFSLEKKDLYLVYSTLSDGYKMQEDYYKATINAERALYLASSNEEILECSLKLASNYHAQDDIDGAIESLENAIKYYMIINSISAKEAMEGNVKDEFLADNHMRLAILLNDQMRGDASDQHLQKAALYGSDFAIETIDKNKETKEENLEINGAKQKLDD